MRTGRPKAPLVLTDEERATLTALGNRARTRPHLALRARLVLLCADGLASSVVARKLHVRDQTVSKWRGRVVRDRLAGLYDEPRPGAPRTITDDAVERVVTRTLETTPRGQTHWSVRGMAQTTGLSRMCENGYKALIDIAGMRPDVLLLDIMDGCRRVRQGLCASIKARSSASLLVVERSRCGLLLLH